VSKRSAIVVAGMAVLRGSLLAAASAHEEHKVDRYTVEVGFGTEPAYVGVTNSVQLIISNNGRPVADAKGLDAAVTAQQAAADEAVAGARRLATIGLVVGVVGLLTAVGVGAVALRRRS
jgi:hypothetical protein